MSTADFTELAASLARLAEHLTTAEPEASQPTPEPEPLPPRTLLTAEEAARQLGIGRTNMYRLIRTGEVRSVRIGNLRRIPTEAITTYVQQLVTEQQAA